MTERRKQLLPTDNVPNNDISVPARRSEPFTVRTPGNCGSELEVTVKNAMESPVDRFVEIRTMLVTDGHPAAVRAPGSK